MSIDLKPSLALVLILILTACSSRTVDDKSAAVGQGKGGTSGQAATPGQTPAADIPSPYSMQIVPLSPDRSSSMTVLPKGFNSTRVTIDWLVNGRPAATGTVFKTAETRQGDSVQAKTTVQGLDIFSNTVQIGNTPPQLTRIKLMPEVFKPGDTLYVEAEASDPDGDSVEILYEWTKNGQPAGKTRTIEGPIRRGDRISLKITPIDNNGKGETAILRREIANMPPMIADDERHSFDGRVFSQTIRATDPDDDKLTYSLKAGPEGMTINASTGEVSWDVPADYLGKVSFSIAVTDGKGGIATQTYNVSVR